MLSEQPSLPERTDSVRAGYGEPLATTSDRPPSWRAALRNAVRDSHELCRILQLDAKLCRTSNVAEASFPVFAPHEFIARMKSGDANDPLLRQVLAVADEEVEVPGFADDPVGDDAAALSPGLIRKYRSRALLITTGACAIHCRYCFRRHFPYAAAPKSVDHWQPALEMIASDAQIDEVILSGGDPLTLVDETLAELAQRIASIEHVQRLRIHTRLPVVIPQRVTSELLAWLRGTRLATIMVIHANHPNEIDSSTTAAITRLVDAGVPVLNQTVLLRGVNDNAPALIELSRKLVNLRAMPYYLHLLDRVRGASHFEVSQAEGESLIEHMRAALPGYAVPRLVRELAGEASKRVVT